MMRVTYTAVLYLVLVFLSGMLVGGFAVNLYNTRSVSALNPSEMRKRYLDEMTSRLKLRPEQVGQVQDILESTRTRFRAVREKWDPELRLIQEQQSERIRAVLDEGQRAEYEKMRQEREKMRHEREKAKPPRSHSVPHAADV